MKYFLSSVFSINSLNSSKIGWNISLMVSPRPSVESLFSFLFSYSSLILSSRSFIISILASSTDLSFFSFLLFVAEISCCLSLLDIFSLVFSCFLRQKITEFSLSLLKSSKFYYLDCFYWNFNTLYVKNFLQKISISFIQRNN